MSVFDILDKIAAQSVDELLAEPVIWRPQRPSTTPYTATPQGEPDDERPVRDDLLAITSWQPLGVPVDVSGQGTFVTAGMLGDGTLMVDFAAAQFETPLMDYYGKPRVHDRLELPYQRREDRLVEITRVGDDGSERFFAWCSVVKE